MPSSLDVNLFLESSFISPFFAPQGVYSSFGVPINGLNLSRDTSTQDFDRYTPTLRRGFLQFTLLETDFGHRDYPNLLAAYAIDLSRNVNGAPPTNCNSVSPLPNQPYTPATNGISIDYKSTQVILESNIEEVESLSNETDSYFHLLPFNGYTTKALEHGTSTPILEDFAPHSAATTCANGNLYIGLENMEPGTNLSLLFQIEEGTEREPDNQPPKPVWSYLTAGNSWTKFRSTDVLKDETMGLTKSGLVLLQIPKTIVRENTMLDPDLHWLRVAVVEENEVNKTVSSFPNLVSVRAQAVKVRFDDRGNDPDRLVQPLPAMTIAKPAVSDAAVKKVEQPFASFGGRVAEGGDVFYRRVSERLRHRERAVTIWDYEHLTLEAFPEVRRVKCLPHTRLSSGSANCPNPGGEDDQYDLCVDAPGYVTLVVIPDLRQRTATRQISPRFSFGDLRRFEAQIREHTSLFVAWQRDEAQSLCPIPEGEEEDRFLWVVNPRYDFVRVCVKLVLHPGFDEEFYRYELNRELTEYFSPWLVDPTADITFGREFSMAAILAFIETRPYVDVIGDLRVYTSTDREDLYNYVDGAEGAPGPNPDCRVEGYRFEPATPRSILTSFEWPDDDREAPDHCIEIVDKSTICLPSSDDSGAGDENEEEENTDTDSDSTGPGDPTSGGN
ncbi:MAG: hypothetical protein AAFY91_05725 [Bacteroidota bacterium]